MVPIYYSRTAVLCDFFFLFPGANSKKDGWKVPSLMAIRVKQGNAAVFLGPK